MSEAQVNQKSIPNRNKSKANSRQVKSIANSRQEKSSANNRQKEKKEMCKKPNADHEESRKHTTHPAQGQRRIH